MAIESQWKDPKKRNRNIVIGLAIAIVVVYGYYNCWFDGPHAYWDINWGPGYCATGGSADNCGGSSGGNACGSCPGGEPCDCEDTKCPDCVPPTYTCGVGDDTRCGGTCPSGYTCEYGYDGCACEPEELPCGWHESNGPMVLVSYMGPLNYCYGDCPYGQSCVENRDTGACTCQYLAPT